MMSQKDEELSQDILRGASAIALFIFGSTSDRRRVYHLAATSNLPTFKMGSMLCARKSVLRGWIAEQESRRGGKRA